jgi:hypothetical protein
LSIFSYQLTFEDFYPYAVLDLVHKHLSAAYSRITKKDYDEAYCILEALTVFNDMESAWLSMFTLFRHSGRNMLTFDLRLPVCDDGEGVNVTNKLYGAAVVTLLRALDKGNRLDATHFPTLEYFLRKVAEWCDEMEKMSGSPDYGLVCKAIGRRLFKDKSDAYVAMEKARLEEWINGLEGEDRAEIEEDLKGEESEAKKEPWYADGKSSDEQDKNQDFVLSRVWKEYKEHLATIPKGPMRGPGTWDISKWTAAQKKEFEFDGQSDSELDD